MNPINYIIDNFMIPFLSFSYGNIFPNYGFAIILLTVLIKVVFYPLTKKQFESMKITQKLQPQVKKIQEKFKGKPQEMHKEMMKLWKDNNANPLGGCLPALIQLPVFFAIFYTIKSTGFQELITQPGVNPGLFSFWAADLGLPDKTYLLPLITAVSTYFSQKMMVVDAKQMNFMKFMPVIMFVISISMPSGVLLYWAVSQVLSTGQQYLIVKQA